MADDPTDLQGLAARLSSDLGVAGIAHAISGSIAMAAHGYVRGTLDIDVLVVTPAITFPKTFEVLRRHGFAGEDRGLIDSIRERSVATLRRGPLAVVILVPVLPYHRTLIDRAVRFDVHGVSVPFLSLDDLIVLKMLWRRAKDIADVHALVALARGRADVAYVERTLRSILPDGDPRIAEVLGILRRPPTARELPDER